MSGGALAYLVAWPGESDEQSIPIYDHLYVGRECSGIEDERRFLIDDDAVSRNHMEVRLDTEQDQAWLVDRSTNGTRLNGTRIERSVPVQIMPGDRVRVGPVEFQFFSRNFVVPSGVDSKSTVRSVAMTELVMVVGDIISFSTISEYTGEVALLEGIDRTYSELRKLLNAYKGTLSNYVGDAFFATWEVGADPEAAALAVGFALDAAAKVHEIGPSLSLRDPDDQPIRMGFGIGSGPAAVSLMTGAMVTVLGDATNVTFRLSGIAGRTGWSDVVVTDSVHALAADRFSYTEPAEVDVKGRTGRVKVYGAAPLGQVATLGTAGMGAPG
ncbi:MAG TPA: adenylate/guanylate cyclase domain-containing protein [Acidimicrobiales bacterium]|nr:adenylate/guanylate cyclase domain-containing protein [Acidimicrobiales bacterium]